MTKKFRLIYYTNKLKGILEGEDVASIENRYFKEKTIDLRINALFFSALAFPQTKNRYLNFERKRITEIGYYLSNKRKINVVRKIAKAIYPDAEITGSEDQTLVKLPLVEFLMMVNINNINTTYVIDNGYVILYPNNAVKLITDLYIAFLKYTFLVNKNEILTQVMTENVKEYFKKKYHIEEVTLKKFPPCIERIINEGVEEGGRNNALFSLLSFFKYLREKYNIQLNDDEIIKYVETANSNFKPPLPDRTVEYMITYHLYGSGKEKVYNFCSFIRKNLPGLCTSDPKTCWRMMLTRKKNDENTKKKVPVKTTVQRNIKQRKTT